MDPLHLTIALGPLAVYCLVLGMINLSPRPFLTTGGRDLAALGVAVSGLVIAGPMELVLPEAAAQRFGAIAWVLMVAMYGLVLLLITLMARPRLVVYNITPPMLKQCLASAAASLDAETTWAGDNLSMPNLGVQAHIDSFGALKNVQVRPSGSRQSYGGWNRLETALAITLRDANSQPNRYGVSLLVFGGLMILIVGISLLNSGPVELARALENMLRW